MCPSQEIGRHFSINVIYNTFVHRLVIAYSPIPGMINDQKLRIQLTNAHPNIKMHQSTINGMKRMTIFVFVSFGTKSNL